MAMNNSLLSLLFSATIGATTLHAQQTPATPQVNSDHSVTFYFSSPGATAVSVSLNDGQQFSLTKSDKPEQAGLWSATTPALAPDLYGYTFKVDGVPALDPVNLQIVPNLLYPSNVLNVPANAPQLWDQTDIPHGLLHHHFYRSAVVGDERDFFVYTPPGFDARRKTKYPVLYLLHGFSDTAAGWSEVGKANLILDALIAQGAARPMIVVMPLGYGVSDYASHGSRNFDDPELTQHNFEKFSAALLTEVLPLVESSYPVLADRSSRAIAGLSMGGAESLLTGLNHVDKFAWVGSFSMGGITDGTAKDDYARIFPALTSKDSAALKLLWISCGTSDALLAGNHKVIAWLKTQGLRPEEIETPGIHSWLVWRRNLAAFVPLLFK